MKKLNVQLFLLFAIFFLSYSCQKENTDSSYEQCVETILATTGFLPYEGNVNSEDECQGIMSAYSFQDDYYFHDGYPCAFIWTPILDCNATPIGAAGDSIYTIFGTQAEFIEYIGVTE